MLIWRKQVALLLYLAGKFDMQKCVKETLTDIPAEMVLL